MKSHVHTKSGTQILIAALFVMAKSENTPSSRKGQIDKPKQRYIHSMEYYSAIKCSEILIHAPTHG